MVNLSGRLKQLPQLPSFCEAFCLLGFMQVMFVLGIFLAAFCFPFHVTLRFDAINYIHTHIWIDIYIERINGFK